MSAVSRSRAATASLLTRAAPRASLPNPRPTRIHLMRTGRVEANLLSINKLMEAGEKSALPEAPGGRGALNDLLVRLRGV